MTGETIQLVAADTQYAEKSYLENKRVFDVIVSTTLLVALSPVILATYLAIRLTSKGPALFSQVRLTRGSREFTMYKFRTMRVDAEKHSGAVWAEENDPRITSIGRFLRKTRLDELPQLVNVLKGEMSLIGPRPERPEFSEQLAKELPSFNRRLEVPAGLTGLAQVELGYAASIDSYQEKLNYDIDYVRRKSMKLDFRIALQTIWVVLSGFGAR